MSVSNGTPGPEATTVESVADLGWWLVDGGAQVVAGPFPTHVDAALSEVSSGVPTDAVVAAYGVRRDDGTLARRFSPDDRAFLAHLSAQLDRLADDWDLLISDADPLTGLVCEVAAALAEAGLPLHDCSGRTSSKALGGVCLTPSPAQQAVIVSWAQHDRISLGQARGRLAEGAVQDTMTAAVGEVLAAFGFVVEGLGDAAAHLVRAAEEHPTVWE
ncbi:hypothetical protein [Modestobacter lacusdianchii]